MVKRWLEKMHLTGKAHVKSLTCKQQATNHNIALKM